MMVYFSRTYGKEWTMTKKMDKFMAAVKSGDLKGAHALLEDEKIKAKFSPDTISTTAGKPVRFTKKGNP